MGQFEGRVALVTGGGRGIGRAISLRLAADGAAVAVNYRRDADAAKQTVADIEAAGGTARAYQASVDDWDADVAMVEAAVNELGPISILVNNGAIASRGLSVADTDPAEMERVVRTHAFGPHYLSKLALPAMRTTDCGDIVMISSVATNNMNANGAPYNMGKAALEALARTLAKEERSHGIHVNVVAPGLVATEMGDRLTKAMTGGRFNAATELDAMSPFGRVCRPEDIANVVAFLCSEQASYVTGQRIEVDGGGGGMG